MMAVVQFVQVDFAAKRIAVNTQQSRGARLIAVGAVENTFDELLFEFVHSFAKKNPSIHHDAN